MSAGTIVLIVLGVILLIVIWYIVTRNKLVTLLNQVEESFATIDVYLKKRHDLIPNLVETVKGYMGHEEKTLTKVIEARNKAISPTANVSEAESELSGALKSLFALTESYPELKADKQFTTLQAQLSSIETDLVQARKFYNAITRNYNTQIQMVPTNIVASRMGLQKKDYFELDSEEERKNVKVSFN